MSGYPSRSRSRSGGARRSRSPAEDFGAGGSGRSPHSPYEDRISRSPASGGRSGSRGRGERRRSPEDSPRLILETPDLCFTFHFIPGGPGPPGLPGDDQAALRGPGPAMRPLPGVVEVEVVGEGEVAVEAELTGTIRSPTR